jgi:hypothetical protein
LKLILEVIASMFRKLENSIRPITDDREQVSILIDADLLPAVHGASGAILTDENGNVVLRY